MRIGMRMRMENTAVQPMPLPKPLPPVAAPPKWWTGNDDADRQQAARGCLIPEGDCVACRLVRCPLSLRTCRVCHGFKSPDGRHGTCMPRGAAVTAAQSCEKWGALQ